MTTDDYGGWTIPYPVKKSNAIKTKVLSHDKLFERQWLKADLSGKKVVQLDFDFNESDEFYAHNDE